MLCVSVCRAFRTRHDASLLIMQCAGAKANSRRCRGRVTPTSLYIPAYHCQAPYHCQAHAQNRHLPWNQLLVRARACSSSCAKNILLQGFAFWILCKAVLARAGLPRALLDSPGPEHHDVPVALDSREQDPWVARKRTNKLWLSFHCSRAAAISWHSTRCI